MAERQHGRMCTEKGLCLACESAGDSTGGRAHSPTAMLWVSYSGEFDVVSLPTAERQKSQLNVSGVVRRETGLFLEKTRRH